MSCKLLYQNQSSCSLLFPSCVPSSPLSKGFFASLFFACIHFLSLLSYHSCQLNQLSQATVSRPTYCSRLLFSPVNYINKSIPHNELAAALCIDLESCLLCRLHCVHTCLPWYYHQLYWYLLQLFTTQYLIQTQKPLPPSQTNRLPFSQPSKDICEAHKYKFDTGLIGEWALFLLGGHATIQKIFHLLRNMSPFTQMLPSDHSESPGIWVLMDYLIHLSLLDTCNSFPLWLYLPPITYYLPSLQYISATPCKHSWVVQGPCSPWAWELALSAISESLAHHELTTSVMIQIHIFWSFLSSSSYLLPTSWHPFLSYQCL